MSPKKETQKSKGFTDEEKAAMKERAKELKAEERAKKDKANLDEGDLWPTTFALKKLTAAEEVKIDALVKKAVS